MGLTVSPDIWHAPYSQFTRWRHALAIAAGWHLEDHRDENGFVWRWPREVNIEALTAENFQGIWERIPEDPLVLLIAHSDCDGTLPPESLIPLAERLEGLVDKMPPPESDPEYRDSEPRGIYDGVRNATVRFAAGLRAAHRNGRAVSFG